MGELKHADDCQSHIVDVRGSPDECTCGADTRPRTEGRGEGEPVAYMLKTASSGHRPVLASYVDAWREKGVSVDAQPLYASPIREPEISRAKRDEIARIIDPEIFADLDLTASQAPQFIPTYSGQRTVDAAYVKADAILNLAPVGGRGDVLLTELFAMVRGECPRLLNEDSGGDGSLSLRIEDHLAALPPPPQEQGGMK